MLCPELDMSLRILLLLMMMMMMMTMTPLITLDAWKVTATSCDVGGPVSEAHHSYVKYDAPMHRDPRWLQMVNRFED